MKPAYESASVPGKLGSTNAARRQDNFLICLLLSLALHALVISMQFGDIGGGLPWFGMPGETRVASIPTLNAILRSEAVADKPTAEQSVKPVVSPSNARAARPLITEPPPPPRLPRESATASIAKLVTLPQETGEKGHVPKAAAKAPKIDTPAPGAAVLSTDQESTWSQPVAQAQLADEGEKEPPLVEKTGEAPVLEKKMIEDLARIEEEKAALAAIAREKELILERKRAEEQARIEEKKKAEQAALSKAREEALAKQAEAEALIRKQQAEQAAAEKAAAERKAAVERAAAEKAAAEKAAAERAAAERAAAERALAGEQSRAANAMAGKPEGGKDIGAGPGPATPKGSDLAMRALDLARSGIPGLPAREAAEPARPRRGSILGRDPKDIQLVFYGEGWRQKIERIGSMNYPKLSKNLVYEPLVVTVSINSDGTLAGLRIDKSSGHREMDEAVRRIVEMSAPFAAFPPDLKRSYDVVDITRTWTFLEERPRITGQ